MAEPMDKRLSSLMVGFAWWLALLLSTWAYWPVLSGPALLDDYINLSPLQALSENQGYFWQLVWENRSGPLGRPISMLSFAFEFVIGDGSIATSKYINLMLHLATGTMVFWCMILLVHRESAPERERLLKFAVIFASAWLLNPFLVSTTAYIVQRMTQLSTLGVLVGCVIFLKARLSSSGALRAWVFGGIGWGCALLFSTFSKESGLLLVPITFLLEIHIRSTGRADGLNAGERAIVIASLVFGLLCMVLMGFNTADDFSHRIFGLKERLLTESRIVWEYVFQFLLPFDRGMGVYHDDQQLSQSLIAPWHTAVAVLGWLGTLGVLVAALWVRAWSLAALGIGFFIVSHLIESTVIPLELYFEHRNYLATVGVSIVLLGLVKEAIRRYESLSLPIIALSTIWVFVLLLPLTYQTSIWSDRSLLTLNAVNKHPNSLRANLEWARLLAERGQITMAIEYVDRAMVADVKNSLGRSDQSAAAEIYRLTMHCIAKNDPGLELFHAMEMNWQGSNHSASLALEVLLNELRQDRCGQRFSMQMSDTLWSIAESNPITRFDPRTLANIARFENNRGSYRRALAYAEAWLLRSPREPKALLMAAYFYANLDEWSKFGDAMEKLENMSDSRVLGSMDDISFQALLSIQPSDQGH
jgi:tetratricopeptide (TPR) repeat protein